MSPSHPGTRPKDPLIGMILGGCKIQDVLGRGGMGAVYKAHHRALDKPVALKLLAPHLAGDKDYIGRFFQEARAAARIEHPNVVQVLNVAEENEQHFIIMGFVEGESVEQILRRETRLGLGRSTRIARDVASGLSALHREGIIHRDIKPANILQGKDGIVKITDFGLARSVRQKQGFTVAGAFMGTPEYVSPEQAEGRDLDARSDLYSLGITYYQMLAGRLPFQGRSAVDVAAKHLRDQPPSLPSIAPDIDGRAVAITQRLLQKDPAERFPDARALIQEFDRILEDLPTVVPNEPPPPPPEPDPIFSMPTQPSPSPPSEMPPPAPPPPPPRLSGLYNARTQASRRVGQRVRNLSFWALVLLGWGLSFVTGVLGAPARGEGFWGGLFRSLAETDESAVLRISLAGVAVVLFVMGFIMNRRAVAASARPAIGICFLIACAALLYAGGVHVPLGAGEGSLLDRVREGLIEARRHPLHLGLLAGWGLLSGILLVAGGSERAIVRIVGCVLAMFSLGMLLVFSSWGYWGAIPKFATGDFGGALTLVSAGVVSVFGLFLAFKRKRHPVVKGVGVLLVVLGAWGAYHFGRQVANNASTVAWKQVEAPGIPIAELLTRQGGLLTAGLLLATWAVWLLRARFGLRQGNYPF